MRYAYGEMATPGMLMLTVSIVVVISGLVSLWDPMHIREALNGTQLVAFVSFVGIFDFLLCYPNVILVLYLARFRSRLQVVLIYIAAAVVLAVPCTAVFLAACSMFVGPMGSNTSHTEFWSVASVHVVSALWAAAVIAYVLVLRLERHGARARKRPTPSDVTPAGEDDGDSWLGRAASSGRDVSPHEAVPVAEDRLVASSPAQDLPASVAQSHGSSERTAGEDERGTHEPHQEAATGCVASDDPGADAMGSHAVEALSGDVVSAHVSGHYVDVVTTTGSSVLLMRLADAMAGLGDRGMQTHRSHWVAYRHMGRLVRRDHRMLLRLSDGREVPVSRPYIRSVRDRINNSSAHASPDRGSPE